MNLYKTLFILLNFQRGDINFAETTRKIEELVVRCLGFSLYWSSEVSKIESHYNKVVHPAPGVQVDLAILPQGGEGCHKNKY